MKKYLLFVTLSLLILVSTNGIAATQPSDCSLFSVPIGGVLIWPSSQIPEDYLPCDGQSYSVDEYKKLFNVIGYTYTPKEDKGRSFFYVPDLRGLFIRGIGGNSLSLGEPQGDAIRNIGGNVGSVIGTGTSGAFTSIPFEGWVGTKPHTGYGTSTVSFNTSEVVPTADENRPINMAMNYIIRYKTILDD